MIFAVSAAQNKYKGEIIMGLFNRRSLNVEEKTDKEILHKINKGFQPGDTPSGNYRYIKEAYKRGIMPSEEERMAAYKKKHK